MTDGYEESLFAARLTSPDYPLQVTRVRFQRFGDLEDKGPVGFGLLAGFIVRP